jgi:CheY-like chemotaxis protein
MSAVLGIVKGHGGALFIESIPGKGSTIRVAFPAFESKVSEIEPNDNSATDKPAYEVTGAMSGTVLVVDDEKTILRICSTMIKHCGYSVITASDGVEAIRIFRDHCDEIDLVLMDLTMPNMDGAAAMQEIRSIKPDTKIILSSGFNEQELDGRISNQSPSGFIRKPYSMKNLGDELRRVMDDVV